MTSWKYLYYFEMHRHACKGNYTSKTPLENYFRMGTFSKFFPSLPKQIESVKSHDNRVTSCLVVDHPNTGNLRRENENIHLLHQSITQLKPLPSHLAPSARCRRVLIAWIKLHTVKGLWAVWGLWWSGSWTELPDRDWTAFGAQGRWQEVDTTCQIIQEIPL